MTDVDEKHIHASMITVFCFLPSTCLLIQQKVF
jgi:hypothetical protein